MKGLNRYEIIGHAGSDPEIRQFDNGNKIATLNIATDESYKDKQTGEIVKRAEWHRCVFNGKIVDTIERYVKKGMLMFVSGKHVTRSFEKDGAKHYVSEMNVFTFRFLSSNNTNNESSTNNGIPDQLEMDDDDLPF